MKIIGISGKAQHGKDTFGGYLKEKLEKEKYKVQKIGVADALKDMAYDDYGWNGKKDNNGRVLLQVLGQLIKQIYGKDYWVKKTIEKFEDDTDFVIITDVRYLIEFSCLEKVRGCFIPLKVTRYKNGKEFDNELTEAQANHSSEVEWLRYKDFEFVLDIEDGFENYKSCAYAIAGEIL